LAAFTNQNACGAKETSAQEDKAVGLRSHGKDAVEINA
jgi:hypothetical protein